MKIQVSLTGLYDHHRTLEWPDGWPVPPVGSEVTLPNGDEELNLTVRAVDWYPEGTPDDPEKFVYVVVGPARP